MNIDQKNPTLFNRYRPKRFSDIVGHDVTMKDLEKRAENGAMPHVMMLMGETGTGKTTLANIVAASINCHNPVQTDHGVEPCGECASCQDVFSGRYARDVRFYDGSDLGKDMVAQIRDDVRYQPMNDEATVIIIDEAQNITSGGFEATLKLLEFEKEDVYIILCTMNPGAFGRAVRDRGQVYEFKRLSSKVIAEKLFDVAEDEAEKGGFELPEEFYSEGLPTLADNSEGSLRRGLSLLERCLNSELYTRAEIETHLGVFGEERTFMVLQKLLSYDPQFFIDIRQVDSKGFYNYAWKVLNETAIRSFNIDNEDQDDWKVKNSRKLLNMRGFWELYRTFDNIATASTYFNERIMMAKLVLFFIENAPETTPTKVKRLQEHSETAHSESDKPRKVRRVKR